MKDFFNLGCSFDVEKSIDPEDIFNELPKPDGVNDLFSAQSRILHKWSSRKSEKVIIIKLNTGGGKTLIGLLIALSSMRELHEPAVYLVENRQLMYQVFNSAKEFGIPALTYSKENFLSADFENGEAILIGTYNSLFNGLSRFGLSDSGNYKKIGCIILDDAHASISTIRNAFSVSILADDDPELYRSIIAPFKEVFESIDKLATYEDFYQGVGNSGVSTLEVPYWAWMDQINDIRKIISKNHEHSKRKRDEKRKIGNGDLNLSNSDNSLIFGWNLIRNYLKYTRMIISQKRITITPYLPITTLFPSFINANRRVFMSATFADDSSIIETFDISFDAVSHPLETDSMAGTGSRLIIPYRKEFGSIEDLAKILINTAKSGKGVLVLTPSDKKAEDWRKLGMNIAIGDNAQEFIAKLQEGTADVPVVLSNRYNGIDLPGDSCRILVMYDMPMGFDDFTKMQEIVLNGSSFMERNTAERIEQGIGRGLRGSSDYCAVILVGKELENWVRINRHLDMFTKATHAQLAIGEKITNENIHDNLDFNEIISQVVSGNSSFKEHITKYTSREVSRFGDVDTNRENLSFVRTERLAFNAWMNGELSRACKEIDQFCSNIDNDVILKGFLYQMKALICFACNNKNGAIVWQERAHACNKNLPRASIEKIESNFSIQARSAVEHITKSFKNAESLKNEIKTWNNALKCDSSSNKFEEAIKQIGNMLGYESLRFDNEGNGPDNLWLIPGEGALIIEVKSKKKADGVFNKDNHGQLLVAEQWFKSNYPNTEYTLVSIHPTNKSTHNSYAVKCTKVLLLDKVKEISNHVSKIAEQIYSSPLPNLELIKLCESLLKENNLLFDDFKNFYLSNFKEI